MNGELWLSVVIRCAIIDHTPKTRNDCNFYYIEKIINVLSYTHFYNYKWLTFSKMTCKYEYKIFIYNIYFMQIKHVMLSFLKFTYLIFFLDVYFKFY